jgi:Na+/H+-dicarboxylate symporter
MKNLLPSLPYRLFFALIAGILTGLAANEAIMNIVVTIQNLLEEFIAFCIPLIIIGFIVPSITKLGNRASKILSLALILASVSSIGAAFLSMVAGYGIIPQMRITPHIAALRELPKLIFDLEFPPVMSIRSALVLSILMGLAACWNKTKVTIDLLAEFQKIVLSIITRAIIPILPFFIALSFCALSYEGSLTRHLPIFMVMILIVMVGHYIWLAVLYGIAGAYSRKNPLRVLGHYGPAYLTALGTMSSAATLAVALRCAKKSDVLRNDMIDFGIPLFANIHLCGSVMTEVFFVMTVSRIRYDVLPELPIMVLFCLILGIFSVGVPGVPGGTVATSLGLIISILGFDSAGTALLLTIFTLQDSFSTACNITGDGALTLILTGYAEKQRPEAG